MDSEKILKGKKILIVDDEEDVLYTLTDLLYMCEIDTASTFEQAKEHLQNSSYDIVVLDIMGVQGFDLLEIANKCDIPALMLTANALSVENLKKSIQEGASFFAPKDEMYNIELFLADVLEARQKNKKAWDRWSERLFDFFGHKFGENWRDDDPEFWRKKFEYL